MKTRSRAGILICALLGGLAGGSLVQRNAKACSCADEEWKVHLRSVDPLDAETTHKAYWPANAVLTSYPDVVYIWDEQITSGVVSRAGAAPWF